MSNICTFFILILFAFTTQAQSKQQLNHQKEFFFSELESLKVLLNREGITYDNYVNHLDHNGPIAVSMLRKSLESYVSMTFFNEEQKQKLIKTVEKAIFKWDAKEVSGDIYIFGEYHNNVNCLERQKDIIEIYNRGEVSLGLEGVISSESRSLDKYKLASFNDHLFGLESPESYSFATLINFHHGLVKRFLNGGFEKNIIIAIARFATQNSYLKNIFKQSTSKGQNLKLLWNRLNQLATEEIELDQIKNEEVRLSITLYEVVAEELLSKFNRNHQGCLSIDEINKILANFTKESNIKKHEREYDKLVLETIDLPRERAFVYAIQRHISFYVLKKPMVIVVGDDHVKRLSALVRDKYPLANIYTTKSLKNVYKESVCLETLDIL